MTVWRDNEKYACRQCIQGHRVSGCQHEDRELIHVNKKGRPVSQCPHCRTLRRSRQTHIKCECGEQRHSRNNSTESAATSQDEGGCASCKCFKGKRCTCALKNDPLEPSDAGRAPPGKRASSVNRVPPRRSEGSIAGFRNSGQTVDFRNGTATGTASRARHLYSLGAGHRNAQRSVDSLPLTSASSGNTTFHNQVNTTPYNTQFLSPHYGFLGASLSTTHLPQVSMQGLGSNEQSIHQESALAQEEQRGFGRTLSPYNNKRHSMVDFPLIPDPNDFSDVQQLHAPPLMGGLEQYHSVATQQSSDGQSLALNPNETYMVPDPLPVRFSSSEVSTYPALSRSSSTTTSEQGESLFTNAMANSSVPTLSSDAALWNSITYDGSEKNPFEFTPPARYQDTISDYASPSDTSSLLPSYCGDVGNNGVYPFSTEPPSGGFHIFPMPGQDNSGWSDKYFSFPSQGLPDRSASTFQPHSVSHGLNTDFVFRADDVAPHEVLPESPLKNSWSPDTDDFQSGGEFELDKTFRFPTSGFISTEPNTESPLKQAWSPDSEGLYGASSA